MIPRSRTTRTGGSRTKWFLAYVLFLLKSHRSYRHAGINQTSIGILDAYEHFITEGTDAFVHWLRMIPGQLEVRLYWLFRSSVLK